MRLRRKPQLRVRLLWERDAVEAIALFLDGECVANIVAGGQMAFTAENVTIEHGGDR